MNSNYTSERSATAAEIARIDFEQLIDESINTLTPEQAGELCPELVDFRRIRDMTRQDLDDLWRETEPELDHGRYM